MRVRVDPQKCQGHTLCKRTAPRVFEIDEEGHSYAERPDVPEAEQEAARRAVLGCPEQAIEIEE